MTQSRPSLSRLLHHGPCGAPSRKSAGRLLAVAGLTGAAATLVALPAAAAHETLPATPAAPAATAVAPSDPQNPTGTPASPFAELISDGLSWQAQAAAQNAPQTAPQQKPADAERLHSWEMPPVEVVGEAPPEYKDDELIGPYAQPRWTAHRLFSTTRTYVLPEGEIDGEYWARIDTPQHGHTGIRNLYEVEIGLPNRFQLDLYLRAQNEGEWDPGNINGQQVEMRYAFADWGKIWGNPTVYLEWGNNYREPDTWEGKLLLADQLAPGWHWGANLSCEQQTTGDNEREVEVTYGISKTITEEKFQVGGEIEMTRVNAEGDRDNFTDSFFVGPSFQYKPSKRTHIDFAPLVGVGGESPKDQIFLIFGYEF